MGRGQKKKNKKGQQPARNQVPTPGPSLQEAPPPLPLLLAQIDLKKTRWKYLGPVIWLVLLIIILLILLYAPKDRVELIIEFIKNFKINSWLGIFFFISIIIFSIFRAIGTVMKRQPDNNSESDLEV